MSIPLFAVVKHNRHNSNVLSIVVMCGGGERVKMNPYFKDFKGLNTKLLFFKLICLHFLRLHCILLL